MKTIKSIITAAALLATTFIKAQPLNWQNVNTENNQMVNVNLGWDYSLSINAGYGYVLKSKFPIVLKGDVTVPSGEKITEDFKVKLGAQVKWFQMGDFAFSTEIDGVFRRYENDYTRLLNFGSYMSGTVGYYKPTWFVAGEFGFDKAIVTHFKSSETMKEVYPGIIDGWYEPPTGGNFNYGISGGYTIKNNDITLKVGKVIEQDFKSDPTIPLYFQLGFNRRF